MFRSRLIPATIATAIIVGGTGAVFAAGDQNKIDGQPEVSAVLNAKTSLSQALTAAEQKIGGKAIDAGVENENGAMAYEVEVAKDNTVQKVLVAMDTGTVIKVMPIDTDHGEDDEHDSD